MRDWELRYYLTEPDMNFSVAGFGLKIKSPAQGSETISEEGVKTNKKKYRKRELYTKISYVSLTRTE